MDWPAFLTRKNPPRKSMPIVEQKASLSGSVVAYGHTGNVTPLQHITRDEADVLLIKDVALFEAGVSRYVRTTINDNQFSALVCFAFNVGLKAFANSTLLNLLNRGWTSQVPAQLMRWTKARGVELPGLVTRRKAEAELWNRKV